MFAYAFIDDPQPEVWTNKSGSGAERLGKPQWFLVTNT
jgi:hypothetical protein